MPPSTPRSSYTIGIMTMEVEGKDSEAFHALVERAVSDFEGGLAEEPALRVEPYTFEGPHLTPGAGAYAPLDFLEIGLAEKLERRTHFLLIVTEVDLSSSTLAYTLALPSQLTNIGIISTKRLDPGFWGETADPKRAAARLSALLLHTFGHLLNLPHSAHPTNVMYPLESVEDLDRMGMLAPEQLAEMRRALPREAHERVARTGRLGFILNVLVTDARAIGRAVVRANPLRLLTKMPTMIAAALSVIIVLLFSAETWDVASAVSVPQVVVFSGASFTAAAFVLYRAFAFDALLSRDRLLTESTVVTAAATVLSLLATLVLLFLFFGGLMYVGIITVFPERLMETWPTTDPATRTLDHLKLSLFLASMGVLAGSLGGRSDSRDLVRSVLFLTEES
ncbi:MAG: hypothetical protein HKN04_12770 [Rhodothermaceae bacterium]|nr:hypothetical protein [Rhodothermaceae bacterium]